MKRRNLNQSPDKSMADIVKGLQAKAAQTTTRAAGISDLGMTGDVVWGTGDGRVSVRDIGADLAAAQGRIDEAAADLAGTQERLTSAEALVGETNNRLTVVETETIPNAVADLEAADAEASQSLADLNSKLANVATTGDLALMREQLQAAQDAAAAAQETANQATSAASAANQAALQATGIADSKGKVIYSEAMPPVEDQSPSNLWIKPSTEQTFTWDGDSWEEITSDSLKQAAQDALDAKTAAATAQAAAESAEAKATQAIADAAKAQATANQATLDARDAHNAAVAAQTNLDAVKADALAGPSLFEDPSFERSKGGLPSLVSSSIERTQEWAGSGAWSVKFAANGNGGNVFAGYGYLPGIPGRWYAASATIHAGAADQSMAISFDTRTAADNNGSSLLVYTVHPYTTGTVPVPANTTVKKTWYFQAPEGTKFIRYWAGLHKDTNTAANTGQTVYLDDFRLVDVTDSYPLIQAAEASVAAAKTRADEAYSLAESRPDAAAVEAAAQAAEEAALVAAAADAQAKADQAKADALAAAADDAAGKAAAAEAAAIATASADAKAKADKALADALAALASARGEISAEIKASANGKNAITISLDAPTASTPGVVAGDTWWRADSAGNIYAQWQWNGTAWTPVMVRNEMIASLDVHKLQVTGEARIDTAVIDKLFAETFAAHKITANELTIAAVNPDGTLADGSVSAVTIKDGAITTPKLTVTEDMAAKIVTAMTVDTKKLVVTEEAILNHATLIGKTVVDDINVQGKLIGTDGVFTGTVDFENVNVTGTQIVNKLEADSISADKIKGGSFEGNTFTGGRFDGAMLIGGIIATSYYASTTGGVHLSTDYGLRAWNSSGKQTVSIDPKNGDLRMGSGVYLTDSNRNGLVLNPPSAIGTASIYFSEGEALDGNAAAIWRLGYNTGKQPLMLRGAYGAGISVKGQSWFDSNVDIAGQTVHQGRSFFYDWVSLFKVPTTSVGSNMYLNPDNGLIARNTSSIRYKKDVEDWSPDADAVLALQPRMWRDRNPLEGMDPDLWHVGFVAEEVDDLGLSGLVQYDDEGRPDALHYDRFAAAQQVVLRDHEARISELESRLAESLERK